MEGSGSVDIVEHGGEEEMHIHGLEEENLWLK